MKDARKRIKVEEEKEKRIGAKRNAVIVFGNNKNKEKKDRFACFSQFANVNFAPFRVRKKGKTGKMYRRMNFMDEFFGLGFRVRKKGKTDGRMDGRTRRGRMVEDRFCALRLRERKNGSMDGKNG